MGEVTNFFGIKIMVFNRKQPPAKAGGFVTDLSEVSDGWFHAQ